MDFNKISEIMEKQLSGYIHHPDMFCSFVDDFDIVAVHWHEPSKISASYFYRLLVYGASERSRGYGKGDLHSDEFSNDFSPFYYDLFDHGALWKKKNGEVICTAFPYGTCEKISSTFQEFKDAFCFSNDLKLAFLEDRYKFRANGDSMVCIYCDGNSTGENK